MLRAKPKRVFDRNINRKLKLTKWANAVPAYVRGGVTSGNREVNYNYHYPPFAYHMKWDGPTVSTYSNISILGQGLWFRISLEFKRKDSRRNRRANWERTKYQNSKEAVITRVTIQFWQKIWFPPFSEKPNLRFFSRSMSENPQFLNPRIATYAQS